MQSQIDVVRSYYIAIDQGNLEKAGQYLSDDFKRFGDTTGPMGKQQTLNTLRLLRTAMPDLKHAVSNMTYQDHVVKLTVQAGGRHLQPLDLSLLGIGISEGVVPDSGRVIIFLPDDLEYTVVDDKITAEHNVTTATLFNGVTGFLHEIGYLG